VSASLPPSVAALREQLAAGLIALDLELPSSNCDDLLGFVDLLMTWNRAYNLTGTSDPREILYRHILDSLSILPSLHGKRVLDVGTGAGLPGVPLAICSPEREFHLLDSNGKKMRFLFAVKTRLRLENLVLIQSRAEDYRYEQGFDTVLSRAVASLGDLVRLSAPLLAPKGRLLAMKGKLAASELAEVEPPYTVRSVQTLQVPGVTALRQIVCIDHDTPQDGHNP
jgi:16S rRNA (guanine527-N7)-methyltransferase